jgi:tripartite-type tricarboxylate transporter receptor subunit TctC
MRLMGFVALLVVAASAAAQTFPAKPLRVIVPQPPGGGFDTVARTLAEPFAAQLGQPVVVENRPGGGTLIGTDAVAKAEPDGYTLLLGASANFVLSAGLYRNLPYDPKADFAPLGLAAAFGYTLVARNDLPQPGLREIVDYARAIPESSPTRPPATAPASTSPQRCSGSWPA